MPKIHKQLTPLEVYDKFRQAHSLVKDIIYADNFKDMSMQLREAAEGVNSVLYMAESIASRDELCRNEKQKHE